MSAIALTTIIALAVATLVSEDLTCIAAGELVRRGQLNLGAGIAGCLVGIYLGDIGLWGLGRFAGARALRWQWIARRVPLDRIQLLGRWFERNAPAAVIGARFVPGLRLPVYFAAGMLQRRAARFALWTLVAAVLWTPLLVIMVARFGDSFVARFQQYIGGGAIASVIACVFAIASLRIACALFTPIGRAKLIARISRIWRWGFWPTFLFYPPVLIWIASLTIRHRGFMTITAANPGIPHGGFVGESKFRILASLSGPHIIESELVDSSERLQSAMEKRGWTLPVILKPDVGQRGAGVRLVRSLDDGRKIIESSRTPLVAQPFHPGPFEAGIFYYRIPSQARGKIFTITDKQFPILVGDGTSTIEEHIWRDPRFRMQAKTFLARHERDRTRVLPEGERFKLAIAGNHCQGTLFRDGSHLITPQLERAIDSIAQRFNGFYFGRFDVRYSDVERFKAGEDLTVIELNGITSESTNIYDPSRSIFRAYATLMRQWSILFEIGAANRQRGQRASRAWSLIRDLIGYYRGPRASALSD